jgi:hypothetical protein
MALANIFPESRALLAFPQAICTRVQPDLRHNGQRRRRSLRNSPACPWITAGVALVGAGVVIVTPVLSLLLAGTLPPSVDITSLDLVLGGLLSPGSSLLNGISATISGLPVSLTGTRSGP